MMTPRAWLGVAVALGAGVACHEDLGPFVPMKWGLVTLDHQDVAGSDYTRPEALFFSSVSSPTLSGRGATDVCGRFPYPPPPDDQPIDEISAGPSVTVDIEGTEHTLVPATVGNRQAYTIPQPGVEYTPGDSVEVRIPGATDGFPEMTIRGQTAEPFTLGTIETDAAPGGLTVTWSPAGNDSSRMVMSLQYHVEPGQGSGLNEQVFCTLRDDGSYTIPRVHVAGWTLAEGARRVQAVRWRTVLETEGDALLYFVSTYSVTKSTFP